MLNDFKCFVSVSFHVAVYASVLFHVFMFITFSCFCVSDSGIGLESGVFVTAIVQGSPAAREGSLTVGDRLIAVSLCQLL